MAETTKLVAVLEADDRTRAGFDSASGGMDKLKKAGLALGVALGAAFAVGRIVEFGKKSVDAFMESERASRQLEYAVVSISKGTMEQVHAIDALAEAMQRKAGIDGDALKIGVAQLSTFGLQSSSVQALTKSLADLTVNQNGVNATADQYQQSANTMAKALNGQFGVLEKSGIRFTEAQQALIMYGTETEKVAALQEGLAQNLKETTDTIGSTAEGAAARFKTSMGEIQESVGGLITSAMTPLFAALTGVAGVMAENLPSSIGELKASLGSFLQELDSQTGLVTLFKDAWANLVFVYNEHLKPALDELWVALQPYKPFLEALAKVFGTMLVVAIGAFIMILGSLAIALAEILTVGAKMATFWSTSVAGAFAAVQHAIEAVIKAVKDLIDWFKKLDVVQGVKNLASKVSGARATGGPVGGGSSYLVGENGPELFTPSSAGRISSAGSFGGAPVVVNVYGDNYGFGDLMGQIEKGLTKGLGSGFKTSP